MLASTKRLLPFLFLTMITYSGCAKQATLHKDEPIAPATVAPPAAAQKEAPNAVSASEDHAPVSGDAISITPLPAGELKESSAPKGAASADNLQKKLDTIYFGFDSSALSDEARATLQKNLQILKDAPSQKVRVEGYCDERGSDEYNLALGQRRAEAAARYLTTLGAPRQQIAVISYGNEKPADAGHDEAAWGRNRRDEFQFVK